MKESLLAIWKILGLFDDTLTAYDKSSVLNTEYIRHPVHVELSRKEKKISEFFSTFLKPRSNFEQIKLRTSINSVR